MHIVIFGSQGSGKGTQSELIQKRYGLPHFSPGVYYRAQVAAGTEFGHQVASYLAKGEIVPSEMVELVVVERVTSPDAERGLVFDGYPRTGEQALQLDGILTGLGHQVTLAIYLKVSDGVAMERLAWRLVCQNPGCGANYHARYYPSKKAGICDLCGAELIRRSDDEPEAIRRRLEIFHQETEPLVGFYRAKGILREIDGERPVDVVFRDIVKVLDTK